MVGFASTTILITKLPINLFIRTIPFLLSCYQGITLTVHGGFASPYRITKLPFYQDYSFNSYSFNQVFPSETKEKSFPKLPRQAQCQSPFNANSAQEISAFQRHPYNYPRRVSNTLTAYTDGSKRHPWCPVLSQNVGKQRGTKFTDPFATSCESYPCCSVLYQGIKKELSSTTSIAVNKSSRRVGDTPPILAHLIGQGGSNTGSVSE